MDKILIAYATKTGTTKEAALEIGQIFTASGLEVDVLPISDINKLDGYEAVVIGAPINGMRWLPEAIKFVEDNQRELNNIPTAYFLLSYLLIEGGNFWNKRIKKSLDKIKRKVNPINVGMFGGKISSEFPSPVRLLFGVKKEAPVDARDWSAVRNWAEELITYLNYK